jgi:hypothetical protein
MRIVAITKYDFCSSCHLYGDSHMVEFKAILPEESPTILLCKDCCNRVMALSQLWRDDAHNNS